jgi:signal transduction histidine kinase
MLDSLIENTNLVEVIIYTFSVFMVMAIILILFFYFSRKKIIKQEQEKSELKILNQKKLLRSIIQTQEVERKRIAQDLHDDISSKLNVVSLNAHLLNTNNLSEVEKDEITNNIIDFTKNALESSRRISHDLLPPVLDKFGLNAGIEELVAEYNSTKSIKVTLNNQLSFENLPLDNQLNIFRILQELLNNSVRHGKATEANILFKRANNKNVCMFSDNGIGFDSTIVQANGIGMKNIESRVEFLNGQLEVSSKINEGIKVYFNFNGNE